MPITRVELRSARSSRKRDNRFLRAGESRLSERPDGAETLIGALDETTTPNEREALEREQLLREVNLTRSLSDECNVPSGAAPDQSTKIKVPDARSTAPGTSERSAASGPSTGKPNSGSETNSSVEDPSVEDLRSILGEEDAGLATSSTPQDPYEQTSSDAGPQPIRGPNAGESRLDLITGEWTLYATTRSQRPDQFANVVVEKSASFDCPFCAGQEARTPDAVWSAKLDDDHDDTKTGSKPDWSVRVMPNLYPAVTDTSRRAPQPKASETNEPSLPASDRHHRSAEAMHSDTPLDGSCAKELHSPRQQAPFPRSPLPTSQLFASEPATGGHEVIVESPRHTESLGELNTAEVALVFAAYAQRIRHWQNVPGIRHVSVFKNVGRDAGASLQHSHSQLIATNRVPAVVQHVTRRMQVHHARTGSCMQCDLVRGEIEHKQRLISQTDRFVAFCPYASRFPMQVRLTSKEHLACFGEMRSAHIAEVARLVLRVVRWLEALRPGTAYNVLLHTCPVDFQGARDSQHWAMDIFPRMSRLAGFELATGAMINPIFPETAAKAYREQARKSDPRYVLR